MILHALLAAAVVFGALAAWVAVQHLRRAHAVRHPEFGAAAEEGPGCLFCFCRDTAACPRRGAPAAPPDPAAPAPGHDHVPGRPD